MDIELKVGKTYKVLGTSFEATVLHKVGKDKYLFLVPSNYATPFVSWTIEELKGEVISCIWGHYYSSLDKAIVEVKMEKPDFGESLMMRLRQRSGLEPKDDSQDLEINKKYSSREAFEEALEWEGIIGYAYTILTFINEAFGTNLNE